MKLNREQRINLFVAGMIIMGIAARFFIDIPNFTAIGAIALFSGAYFTNRKLAIFFPLSILFISDLFLGLHSTMGFVYIAYFWIILMGMGLRYNKKPLYIAGASIAGSVIFYLFTNFGVWITGMGISPSLLGVYVDGLPFFRNMLASDLLFNGILFGTAALVFPERKTVKTIPVKK